MRTKQLEGDNQFCPTMRQPTEAEKVKIIGQAVSAGINACMGNHFYKINGEIRCQAKGRAIGSELTGEVSRNFMIN